MSLMTPRTVAIRYFAILRERRSADRESVSTGAKTLQELYEELAEKHNLGLPLGLIKFAVNGEFVSPSTPLSEGMEVVLIPPVAGG